MKVGLFIPCYVDQLFPQVAWAMVDLMRKLGVDFEVPPAQTCCGQPLFNSGQWNTAKPFVSKFQNTFSKFDAIVAPSASCVSMVRTNFKNLEPEMSPELEALTQRTYELCEFLWDVLGVRQLDVELKQKVALHQSCQGLRTLGLGRPSEIAVRKPCKVTSVLQLVRGLEVVKLSGRPDECCGFGGSFCVTEGEVARSMACDRIGVFREAGADVVTATDMSCLMHLDGVMKKERSPLRVMHVAEILAGAVR